MKRKLGKKIDVFGFDACLMGMSEVAGQIREGVDIFVASEAEIPNESWPYEQILGELRDRPSMTPDDLSRVVVSRYVTHYALEQHHLPEPFRLPVALSALDLGDEKYKRFTAAVERLSKDLSKGIKNEFVNFVVRASLQRTVTYFGRTYVDLYDFCDQLARLLGEGLRQVGTHPMLSQGVLPKVESAAARRIAASCENVKKVIAEGRFVLHSGFYGRAYARSRGVSIFLPVISRCYTRLLFARDTKWGDFLEQFAVSSFKERSRESEPPEYDAVRRMRDRGRDASQRFSRGA
jgi:hypothetical protein